MKNDLSITVQMPANVILRAMFERCIEALPDDGPGDVISLRERNRSRVVGDKCQDGTYAGLTLQGEDPHELILLPGEFNGPWKEAVAWAEQQGGVLPSRFDLLVLFKNLKSEFKAEWYWSGEQYASYPSYACIQSFYYGYQLSGHKDSHYRARAVRRLIIQ